MNKGVSFQCVSRKYETFMSNPKFIFDVDNQIVSFDAGQFGEENLYVNNELIESNRKFRLSGNYKFLINDNEYTLKCRVINMFTGKIECNLYKGNILLSSKYTVAKLGDKNKFISLLLLLFLCGLLGVVAPKMGSWIWLSPFLFILAVIVAMSCRERIYDVETKN